MNANYYWKLIICKAKVIYERQCSFTFCKVDIAPTCQGGFQDNILMPWNTASPDIQQKVLKSTSLSKENLRDSKLTDRPSSSPDINILKTRGSV